MIQINLLPPSMRVVQKVREPGKPLALGNKILIYAGAGAAGLLVTIYAITVLLPGLLVASQTRRLNKEWKQMEEKFGVVDKTSKEGKMSGARLAELARKKEGRWRWAEILNAVSDVMPPSIQLTRISSGQLVEMVPLPPAKAAAQAPKAAPKSEALPAQKTRRYYQALEMEGVVEKGALGEEDLKTLMREIRAHPVFNETFERIELVGVATQPDRSKKFSLRCRFKEKPS